LAHEVSKKDHGRLTYEFVLNKHQIAERLDVRLFTELQKVASELGIGCHLITK
jgi:hypothetical protein